MKTLPVTLTENKISRWSPLKNLYGDGSLLASRQDRRGNPLTLLIYEDGRKRELYSRDSKITDITDVSGLKRTYIYQHVKDFIRGKMICEKSDKKDQPLITNLNWTNNGTTPQYVEMAINSKNKNAQILLPEPANQEKVTKASPVTLKRVLAKHFDSGINPVPKDLEIETVDGSVKTYKSSQAIDLYRTIANLADNRDVLSYLQVLV